MLRRSHRFSRAGRGFACGVVLCAFVAGACGGNLGAISKGAAVTSTTTPTTTSTTTSATTTIAPAPPAPVDTAPPVPPTVLSAPGNPGGGVPGEVVRPPAAWIGLGVPQPGSMFENLQEDHSLDGKGAFVALTFDDGPSQYTQQIVDILRFMGVQATFFVIGKQALARQDLVRQMLLAGMRIGSHTDNHPHLPEVALPQKQQEVLGSVDRLNEAFGAGTIKCFRPPYAEYDQEVLDMVAQRGAATAMWSLDTLDWHKPSWTSMVVRVVNGAKDRQVILFHDGGGDRTQTILALPWIIQGLRNRGFQFVAVC